MNIWPIEIKPPLVDSFALAYRQREQLIQFQSTAQRQYRHSIEPGYKVTCQLLLTKAEMEVFRKWYIFDLGQGADWFTADWTTFIGRIDYPVKFTKPYESSNKGHLVMVGLDLMVSSSLTPCESHPSEWPSNRPIHAQYPHSKIVTYSHHFGFTQPGNFSGLGWAGMPWYMGAALTRHGKYLYLPTCDDKDGLNARIEKFQLDTDLTNYIKDEVFSIPHGIDPALDPDTSSISFGSGLAITGDGQRLVVGIGNYNSALVANIGAVFVYALSDTGGALVQSLHGREGQAEPDDLSFGGAVAVSDNGAVLTVGAKGTYVDASNTGRVLIYDWNGSQYIYRNELVNPLLGAEFGKDVTINHDGSMIIASRRSLHIIYNVDPITGIFTGNMDNIYAAGNGSQGSIEYFKMTADGLVAMSEYEISFVHGNRFYSIDKDHPTSFATVFSETSQDEQDVYMHAGAGISPEGDVAVAITHRQEITDPYDVHVMVRDDVIAVTPPDCGGPTAP